TGGGGAGARASALSATGHTGIYHLPRHDRRGASPDAGRDRPETGSGFLSRVLAGAGRSGQRTVPHSEHSKGRRRSIIDVNGGNGRPLPDGSPASPQGVQRAGGRNGQAAGKHFPLGQHWAG